MYRMEFRQSRILPQPSAGEIIQAVCACNVAYLCQQSAHLKSSWIYSVQRVFFGHIACASIREINKSPTDPSPRLCRPRATSKQRSHITQPDCHVSLEMPSAMWTQREHTVLEIWQRHTRQTVRADHIIGGGVGGVGEVGGVGCSFLELG